MKKIIVLLVLLATIGLGAYQPHFMKDPEISADGSRVCFSYLNDLWLVDYTGGIAKRLTSVAGNDWNAQYSPDGEKIAFNTNRNGWTQIYLMPAEGGNAKLICSEPFRILDWFPDNQHLLVSGSEPGFRNIFYKLNLEGNYQQLNLWGANNAKLDSSGQKIIFNKRGLPYRETYTGSFNGDIWEYDIKNDEFKRLTSTEYSEMYPVYSHISQKIYYAAAKGKNFHLFKTVDFKDKNQISKSAQLGNWSVRNLEIARKSDRIVFELFDQIWKYEPEKNSISKLEIRINEDAISEGIVREEVRNKAKAFAISPDGNFIVFSYKYDLFAIPTTGGEVKQLTKDQAGIENIAIMPDNEIFFTSFKDGEPKLYQISLGEPFQKKLVKWSEDILVNNLQKSDKHILVYYSDYKRAGMLAIVDSTGKLLTKIKEPFLDSDSNSASVSPDGKYLAYIELKPGIWTRHLHIRDLQDKTDKLVYNSEDYLSNFYWGKDDKSAFIARGGNIYRIDLQAKDDFPNWEDKWAEILSEKKKDENDNKKPATTELSIDWTNLADRVHKIVEQNGWNFPIHIASDSTFYYMNNFEDKLSLHKCDYFGKNEELIYEFKKDRINFEFCEANNRLYYEDGERLYALDVNKKSPELVKSDFKYTYNEYKLNQDIFKQVWSKFGSGFYDPDMHGVDWQKAKKMYGEYTQYAYSPNQLKAIVNEMIGDVNASHTGFYPRSDSQVENRRRAYGGFVLDTQNFPPRGLQFKKIYQNSKLNQPFGIKAGDILLEVDGHKVGKGVALYPLFMGKVGEKIDLKILSDGVEKNVSIKGLSSSENYSMYYDDWVKERQQKVDQLSNGKFGYVHIRAMNNNSYEKFVQDVFAENYDKEALIIDVRNNPGGNIHDRLVEVLTKSPYAKTAPRYAGGKKFKTPGKVWEKPVVLIINENSFSDAEIFPNLFKELKLGKVIGMPTSGSVIGTGHVYFMDGSSMRMPSNGWYNLNNVNMEGNGAEPDIYVEPTPKQIIADDDIQLQRAVEELKKELEE
ncbi:MAG: tricorn protease [Candidatus Cloacimonadota bacterium]|jgi:C-terminal processing protease CtpA/Prc/tricorn protease-like protein|nr:tricorn protease [Candidatus Cloacimonadota bacterium]